MWDLFQLIVLVIIIFYFYFQLDRKLDLIYKEMKNENKVLNQKIGGLGQLLAALIKHG